MSYKIILKCSNERDEERYGRILYINNYEAADVTYKVLAKSALENLIDPYILEFYYPDDSDAPATKCRLRLEKLI